MSDNQVALNAAVTDYIITLSQYETQKDQPSYSVIELAKLRIADHVLLLLEIPTAQRTPVTLLPQDHSKRSKTHVVSMTTRLAVLRRDGYKCVKCQADTWLSIDHIRPQAMGGLGTEDNLQTLCRSCNSRKGARSNA